MDYMVNIPLLQDYAEFNTATIESMNNEISL